MGPTHYVIMSRRSLRRRSFDLKPLIELARYEMRTLEPCVHGGEIWEVMKGGDQRKIIDFSSNINPLGPSPKVLAAVRRIFWQIPFYPDSVSSDLRTRIADHLNLDTENIIVGNGSTELIWLFSDIFIKKGDVAIVPAPTFGEYEITVRKAGGRPKFVELNHSDFRVRADDFVDRMGARTKVIFLCNPNNPTGQIIAEEELLRIVEEAEQRGILVLIDEDFMGFVGEDKRFTLVGSVSANRNVFVLRSFTKIFALTGLRIGYGVGCDEMIELLHRAKPPWNVNCLAQAAAVAALADSEYIGKTQRLIAEERAHMLKGLARINGLRVFPTDANFVLIDTRNTGLTAAQLKEKLLEHCILVRDCSSFRGLDEHFVRIAIRTREENEKLLKAMKAILGA